MLEKGFHWWVYRRAGSLTSSCIRVHMHRCRGSCLIGVRSSVRCMSVNSLLLTCTARTFRNVFSPSFVKCNLELPPRTPTGVGRAAHAAKWLKAIFREVRGATYQESNTILTMFTSEQKPERHARRYLGAFVSGSTVAGLCTERHHLAAP